MLNKDTVEVCLTALLLEQTNWTYVCVSLRESNAKILSLNHYNKNASCNQPPQAE